MCRHRDGWGVGHPCGRWVFVPSFSHPFCVLGVAGFEDFLWIDEHYGGPQKRYPSVCIAVKDGKVLAAGKGFDAVYDGAEKRVVGVCGRLHLLG